MKNMSYQMVPNRALVSVALLLAAVATLLSAGVQVGAQTCPDAGEAPTPTEVTVTAVPIVVESTTADYFVLHASRDMDEETVWYPVKVAVGEEGTTTVAENMAALPVERYRVEKYSVANPADVDGDCTDDMTELNDLGVMNSVNNDITASEGSSGAMRPPVRRATGAAFEQGAARRDSPGPSTAGAWTAASPAATCPMLLKTLPRKPRPPDRPQGPLSASLSPPTTGFTPSRAARSGPPTRGQQGVDRGDQRGPHRVEPLGCERHGEHRRRRAARQGIHEGAGARAGGVPIRTASLRLRTFT